MSTQVIDRSCCTVRAFAKPGKRKRPLDSPFWLNPPMSIPLISTTTSVWVTGSHLPSPLQHRKSGACWLRWISLLGLPLAMDLALVRAGRPEPWHREVLRP